MGVTLTDITCVFGGVPAVRDVGLTVATGEFLALVGPSGAGKSTLLRIIAGLQPGYTGAVRIGERDVDQVPARARNIGFVFQNYALFGHMSVAENVAFGLRVRPRKRRPDRAAIAGRVAELLELVQVGALAERYPAQLSGGQRQRVALARALATEPELLLLDEPFGALDPLVRKEIRTWLRSLHDRLGLTSILVTHDQAEALDVADRIAVLRDGRLEQVDTPDRLEDHPANAFVHRFLGQTIAFPARVMIDGGGAVLNLDGAWHDIAHSLPPVDGFAPGEVLLSIRPHDAGLLPLTQGSAPRLPVARVVSLRRSGGFLHVTVMPAAGQDSVAITLSLPGIRGGITAGWTAGMACRLDLSAGRLFTRAGGAAVWPSGHAVSAAA